ncbi:MAG: nucleotide exchange factor GrpE [Alistipes sp.]|nr:nucleotide exchange factor GrpE [Alistipes sp.]
MTDEKDESASEEQFEEPSPEEVIAVWRDKYMRLQAEFDNYRKRTLREKMDLVASGGADVLKNMLAVLDDMYRAVAASEKSEDIAALREGEKLVLQKFEEALKQKNVTEIKAVGEEFNADYHEAVARFAAGEEMKGKVIDVVQRGYMLGDKVLRYAKVVVGE